MNKDDRFRTRAIALASTISTLLVAPLLVGIFVGRWVDVKFATYPLFMIIGLLSGLALGVYGITRLLKDRIQGD